MTTLRQQLSMRDDAPTGRGIRIAILDTGVDSEHPDLQERVDLEKSATFACLSTHNDILDRNGHGTHVAGIIAGSGKASNGLYRGVAPNSQLIIYKIASEARGAESNAIAAIGAAISAKVDILNYSHGYSPMRAVGHPPWLWPTETNPVEDAFEAARQAGILCVVAAGNEGPASGSITRPGGLESVLTVGSITPDGNVLESSSRGPYHTSGDLRSGGVTRYDPDVHRNVKTRAKPDVVAPGHCVCGPRTRHGPPPISELEDPDYILMSGTSQATAAVTGLAACLLELSRSEKIDLGPSPARTLHRILCRGASPLASGSSSDVGSGRLNWPMIQATLAEFAGDAQLRRVILEDQPLRLLPP